MDEKKKLVSVAGLRRADPTTLQVLTQDVLRTPLVRIEPGTLVDLLALSELGDDQVPGAMVKELARFQRQMFREMADLPDGVALIGFVRSLQGIAPQALPSCLREALALLAPERKDADTIAAIEELVEYAASAPAQKVVLPRAPERTSPNNAKVTRVAPVRQPTARSGQTAESRMAEDHRAEWVQGDVLERLRHYPSGLKEAILVAGSKHRAPWQDLTDEEILKVLRRLRREGRCRFSAGRWFPST